MAAAAAAPPPPPRCLGRCRCSFWLAILFDAMGLGTLLPGVLLEEGDYSDLMVYVAGVNFFFSLPWWVFWYVGNLEVPPEKPPDDGGLGDPEKRPGQGAGRLLRDLGSRFRATFGCRPPPSSASSAPVQQPRFARSELWSGQESPTIP